MNVVVFDKADLERMFQNEEIEGREKAIIEKYISSLPTVETKDIACWKEVTRYECSECGCVQEFPTKKCQRCGKVMIQKGR